MANMIKKAIFIFIAFVFSFGLFSSVAHGQEKQVTIYFFRGEGCPHCAKEEVFLATLKEKYPNIVVRDFEVWHSSDNQDLLTKFSQRLNANASGVPFTVIGDKYFVGYLDDETTGKSIEDTIKNDLKVGCQDIGSQVLGEKATAEGQVCEGNKSGVPEMIKVPIAGEVNVKKLSLPALTVIFGILDGFNPCSMWALIFLISLLISMGNKKRLLILGSAFIITSAVSYFLFMTAWLNLFLFIGFIVWVRIIIGVVALGSGYYNLKEFFTNKDAACKVSKGETTKNLLQKLRESVNHEKLLMALIGVIALAFSVNLIELVCSAGFPAIYTQVLSLSHLPRWQYYAYIWSYVFFYDLDEIIVMVIALFTFRITVNSNRFTHWSQLIGGILMIILGLLLIFKHEWLMFG
jgi:hypothetical protein